MRDSANAIDILIPVFEAAEDVVACLESVIAFTPSEHSVVVLDDASKNSEIERSVSGLSRRHPQVLYDRSDSNLGFVGNVNRALHRTRNDVLILNSDTLVTPGWLEAIIDCRDSSESIGIVSPLSNNATILSVPRFNSYNDLPVGTTPAEMASLVAAVSKRTYPRIPTAVGFCMLITRRTIDRLGSLDPAFGRGYGEECDYSVRAWRSGIEVACCDNAFVFHRGSASFGHGATVSGERSRNRHLLNQRWPGYERAVQRFCINNPLRPLQTRLADRCEARAGDTHASLAHVLSLCHRWETTGGVEEHVKDISTGLVGRFRFSIVYPGERPEHWTDFSEQRSTDNVKTIAWHHSIPQHTPSVLGFPVQIDLTQAEADLSRLLEGSDAAIVHIHHLARWNSLRLPSIARRLGKKVIISLHDYYLLCPNYNMLLPQDHVPCNQAVLDLANETCRVCLAALVEPSTSMLVRQMPPDFSVQRYRMVHDALIEADALVAPSRFVQNAFGLAFGQYIADRIRVIPHGVPRMGLAEAYPTPGGLRVAYVGNLNLAKGAQLLIDAVTSLRKENISFVVHGNVDQAFIPRLAGLNIQMTGGYRREQLAARLRGIDVVIVLSIWNETFCMALSEAQAAGIPVIAPRAGGITERIHDGTNGFLYELGDSRSLTALLREFSRSRIRLDMVRRLLRNQPPRFMAEMLDDYRKLYEDLLLSTSDGIPIAAGQKNEGKTDDSGGELSKRHNFLDDLGLPFDTDDLGHPEYSAWYAARRLRAAAEDATNCGASTIRLCWLVLVESSTLVWLPRSIASIKGVVAADSDIVLLLAGPTLELPPLPDGIEVAVIDGAGEQLTPRLLRLVAADVEWVALLNSGDEVSRDIAADLCQPQFQEDAIKAIYLDEDRITVRGEHYAPVFKPDFDRLWFMSAPYVGDFAFCRPTEVVAAGLTSGDLPLASYAVLASVMDRHGGKAIGHVSGIHCHALDIPRMSLARRLEAVARILARQIRDGSHRIEIDQEREHCRMLPAISTRPGISIIVASANPGLLDHCLRTLVAHTDYSDIELIAVLVGHDSLDQLKQAYRQSVRILALPASASHAEALHHGCMHAHKEFLVLLSDAISITGASWAEELVSAFSEDDIGVVGGKVIRLHQDICTGGLIIGAGPDGIADYAGVHSLDESIVPAPPREFSALPGEFIGIRRKLFLDLGGLSFRHYGRTYWSIDFCLRVKEAGFRVCWTPRLTVTLHGPASLAMGTDPEHMAAAERNERNHLLQHWKPCLLRDPAYNDCLSVAVERLGLPDADNIPKNRFSTGNVASLPRLLISPFDSWGSGHYRTRGPGLALASAGKAKVRILPSHESGITPTIADVWRFSPRTMLVHNFLHDYQLQALASYRAHCDVKIVMGLDDLLTDIPAYNPYKSTIYRDIETRLANALGLCDRLIVTTDYLASHFRFLIKDIRIIPNYLENERWQAAQGQSRRFQNGRIRVGWAGATQHLGDLQMLALVVKHTCKVVDWIFFGQCPSEIAPYALEVHPMVPFEDYPRRLASLNLDVAVAPLLHNRFNRAKSNLRILEYGILGLPVICSDIDPYQDAPVLRLSDVPDGWIEAIHEYARSPRRAEFEGATLRNWVMENWLLENHLAEWADALMLC